MTTHSIAHVNDAFWIVELGLDGRRGWLDSKDNWIKIKEGNKTMTGSRRIDDLGHRTAVCHCLYRPKCRWELLPGEPARSPLLAEDQCRFEFGIGKFLMS